MAYESVNKEVKTCALLVRNNTSVAATALKLAVERWAVGLGSEHCFNVEPFPETEGFTTGSSNSLSLQHCTVVPRSYFFLDDVLYQAVSIDRSCSSADVYVVARPFELLSTIDTHRAEQEMCRLPVDAEFARRCTPAVCLRHGAIAEFLFP